MAKTAWLRRHEIHVISEQQLLSLRTISMTTEIDDLLEDTTVEYLQLLSAFSEEQFNIVPFEGSWTVGQVTDHVNKSNAALLHSLNSTGEKAERDILQKVDGLRTSLLNFEKKFTSPQFILPGDGLHSKEEAMLAFESLMNQLRRSGNTVDLSNLIRHPILGAITKIEMLHFVVFHTRRHIYQLTNIAKAFAKQTSVHQVQ